MIQLVCKDGWNQIDKSGSNQSKKFSLKIIDIHGREVLKTTQIVGGRVERIDLSDLKNQYYIIILESEVGSISKKVMKM